MDPESSFADRFFHTRVIGVFFGSYMFFFPFSKIKIKVSGDSEAKLFLLGDGFFKIRNSTHIFFSFLKASRAGPLDRVMVHKLATPLGIEPRISGFIRGSNLNLNGVYLSTWFSDW